MNEAALLLFLQHRVDPQEPGQNHDKKKGVSSVTIPKDKDGRQEANDSVNEIAIKLLERI